VASVPYICLCLAVVLIYGPRFLGFGAQLRQPEGLDNAYPRAQQARLTGLGARAQSAHMNGFEAFGPFAVGVLACEARGVDAGRIAWLSIAFVVFRSIYIGLYLGNVPTARTVVWALGLGAASALLVLAALG